MTEEELASEHGRVATRPGDDAAAETEQVFTPKDFRLDLRTRLAIPADEPLPNLDSPEIRKLTWEHVVPDRPVPSTPSAATIVPLPPPSRVAPPLPPQPAMPLQPPQPTVVKHLLVEPEPDVVADEPVAEVLVDEEGDDLDEADDDDVEEELVAEADEQDDEAEEVIVVVSAAEAEVNRLASVPDLFEEDDESPIELPPITPSGPGPIVVQSPVVYAPVLAENYYVPPAQRQPTTTVARSSLTVSPREASRVASRSAICCGRSSRSWCCSVCWAAEPSPRRSTC